MGCGLSKAHIRPEVLVAHAHARTTFHGRPLVVARSRAGWPEAHIGAAMGSSTSNDERAAALAPWIEHYNTRRRLGALGGLPPITRLLPT